jgi:tetratricopeptide (TPR) repeat protein
MALFHEAHAAYERGEYRAAMTKLESAIALDPDGVELVYNLALIHEKLGEIEDAEREYRRYLTLESDPKQRERVQGILKRLEGAKKDVQEHHDGAVPPVAPPPPVAPLPTAQAPAARFSGVRNPWVFVLGGTAAGALAVGSAFAISAVASKPGSNATTGDGVTFADLQADAMAAHRRAMVADISFAIAAITGAAALYLEITGRHAKSNASPSSGAPTLAQRGPNLEVRF